MYLAEAIIMLPTAVHPHSQHSNLDININQQAAVAQRA
jgi:hypothetical protein